MTRESGAVKEDEPSERKGDNQDNERTIETEAIQHIRTAAELQEVGRGMETCQSQSWSRRCRQSQYQGI